MNLSSVRSEMARRSRTFSVSSSFSRFTLVALQPAELLSPAIIRHLGHPDLTDRIGNALALRDQNIDLPQLRNDLFRLVPLPRHCSPPSCQKTCLRSDHFC